MCKNWPRLVDKSNLRVTDFIEVHSIQTNIGVIKNDRHDRELCDAVEKAIAPILIKRATEQT